MTSTSIVRSACTLILLAAAAATPLVTAGIVTAVGPTDAGKTVSEDQLLQYTSAGHVLRFDGNGVIVASTTHMVKMEFVGANQVAPVAQGANAGEPDSAEEAATLGRVTYEGLWNGVTVVYEAATALS